MEKRYDVRQIMQSLPHRYPFLLIDRILEVVPHERVVALKNVTINEPFFDGHFPGIPIFPGVLILEAMGQAGGILIEVSRGLEPNQMLYFSAMDRVRFRKPVVPGDQLRIAGHLLKLRSKVAKIEATAFVGETLVAEAQLMANFGDQP